MPGPTLTEARAGFPGPGPVGPTGVPLPPGLMSPPIGLIRCVVRAVTPGCPTPTLGMPPITPPGAIARRPPPPAAVPDRIPAPGGVVVARVAPLVEEGVATAGNGPTDGDGNTGVGLIVPLGIGPLPVGTAPIIPVLVGGVMTDPVETPPSTSPG